MIRFPFRRRSSGDTRCDELTEATRKVEQLEARASYVVPRVVAEGQRNHFAERLRQTLPRPNGA